MLDAEYQIVIVILITQFLIRAPGASPNTIHANS